MKNFYCLKKKNGLVRNGKMLGIVVTGEAVPVWIWQSHFGVLVCNVRIFFPKLYFQIATSHLVAIQVVCNTCQCLALFFIVSVEHRSLKVCRFGPSFRAYDKKWNFWLCCPVCVRSLPSVTTTMATVWVTRPGWWLIWRIKVSEGGSI